MVRLAADGGDPNRFLGTVPNRFLGTVKVCLRLDQQGKFRVNDVVQDMRGIEFAFDIDEGPTNQISC